MENITVPWCCWLGGRKGIQPVKKLSGEMLAWLSVWCEVQICIWPSWCHCHSLSLAPATAPVKPDWSYFPGFIFLVPAHPGSQGHSPGDRKMVVAVAVAVTTDGTDRWDMPVPSTLSFYRPDILPAAQPTASKHCNDNENENVLQTPHTAKMTEEQQMPCNIMHMITWAKNFSSFAGFLCLQCFDAVGWVARRASGL